MCAMMVQNGGWVNADLQSKPLLRRSHSARSSSQRITNNRWSRQALTPQPSRASSPHGEGHLRRRKPDSEEEERSLRRPRTAEPGGHISPDDMASTEGKFSSWLQYHLGQSPASYGRPKSKAQAKKSAKLTCKQIYQASHRPAFWKSQSNLEMTPTSASRHAKAGMDSTSPAAPMFWLTSNRLGRSNGGQYPINVSKDCSIRQADDLYAEQESTLARLRSARQRLLGTTRSDHDSLLPLRKPPVSSFKEMKFFDTATIVTCSHTKPNRNSVKVAPKTCSHQIRNGGRVAHNSINKPNEQTTPALDNIKVQGKSSTNENSKLDKRKKHSQLSLSEYFCVIVESPDVDPSQAYCPTVPDADSLEDQEHEVGKEDEVGQGGSDLTEEELSSKEEEEVTSAHRTDAPLKRNVRFSVQNEVLEYEPWQPIEPDSNIGG